MINTAADEFLPTLEQRSAGGVVYRYNGASREVVIIKMLPEMRWQLPKGLIDEGETSEQAALREVREESGIEAELVSPIDAIQYWFTAEWNGERRRIHKFVQFYLMKYRAGDVNDHDHEVEEARWTTIDTALSMLNFQSERDIVSKAVAILEESE
jgi:8-oxo-dGTP diphosphatase